MQRLKIQISVDPVRAAQKRLDVQGIVPAANLGRLAESTKGICKDIETNLSFDFDLQKLPIIKGTAEVDVMLECQRCSDAFQYTCKAEFIYTPVRFGAEDTDLPSAYDVIERDEEGEINLHQLVEDELIINLPLIAMHEVEDCGIKEFDTSFGEIVEEERVNPFAVLESLKRKSK
ncbi:23S rRNA accumulation protein YceD [Motilimonas eburnea]|uniref:23S rRNA accumulation protein YceD n=1 Tax=Motilimonas eburnea TaxID=1737488 RepID=UPI001E2C120F|nr:23S rRNA accumulation protein YceD [Motilimonas eburnea]MCE2570325.1 23S rRNA accumulation protein YceD [Motilimonas eburnea]